MKHNIYKMKEPLTQQQQAQLSLCLCFSQSDVELMHYTPYILNTRRINQTLVTLILFKITSSYVW